ncbi:MAG: hypothetical protein OXU25_01020, partial [Thaumarchaeota archaeon]|nr:hypothetical protein [Nitrososphaerota archaeon]
TEIRLRILFGRYAELYHEQPGMEYLKGISGVKESVVKANMARIVDAGQGMGGARGACLTRAPGAP